MTTRRWVISVAAATLVVGGFIGVDRLNRRAVRFGNMADYHRRMEQESDAKAAFFEGLASDPSQETDLPPALFDEGIWSRGQALEMELESTISPLVAKASLMVAFRSAKGAHPLFPSPERTAVRPAKHARSQVPRRLPTPRPRGPYLGCFCRSIVSGDHRAAGTRGQGAITC
jgi:hypothetical protein